MTERTLTDPAIVWVSAGPDSTCCACGVVFWMTQQMYDRLLQSHKAFYCPNGHSQSFIAETEAQKYKRLYGQAEDRAAAARAERDQAEASRRAWKGQVTRLRKQVIEGSCPFCGQHLRDLERHVARQHPNEQADSREHEVM